MARMSVDGIAFSRLLSVTSLRPSAWCSCQKQLRSFCWWVGWKWCRFRSCWSPENLFVPALHVLMLGRHQKWLA